MAAFVARHPSRSSAKVKDFVNFLVQDTGIGMSQQFIDNEPFMPFTQADSHVAGTGLGMSIIEHIAKELNAIIEVSSEVGKGTTVKIRFKATFKNSNVTEAEGSDSSVQSLLHQSHQRVEIVDMGTSLQHEEAIRQQSAAFPGLRLTG
jgi:hypothetical protein